MVEWKTSGIAPIITKDYYRNLQVPANASQQDVRNAFRRASKYFHPDRVPAEQVAAKEWATSKFQALGEAFEVLSDPLMRERYDEDLFGDRRNARFVRSASWRDLSTELPMGQFLTCLRLLEKGFRFDVLADSYTKGYGPGSGLNLDVMEFVLSGLLADKMAFNFEFWMKVANAIRTKYRYDQIISEMNAALDYHLREWFPQDNNAIFAIALDDQYPEEMRAKAREALASDGKWVTKQLEAANP